MRRGVSRTLSFDEYYGFVFERDILPYPTSFDGYYSSYARVILPYPISFDAYYSSLLGAVSDS